MDTTRTAIREAIERIPNFFGQTRNVTIGAEGATETIVYTQSQIADLIACVLPGSLQAKGYALTKLPGIETDQPGRRYVRVPITAQPWADGEVRIAPNGDRVSIVNVPAGLPMQDVPALAVALLAAHASQ
ncbi:hypothetical protein [Mycobacteroides abscessus]|uniref:hypothetical protein n=1 Tax=Mycobacteroides abscessus TaxID=36809 RepID=UPI00092ABBC8|nr:hypothetical protein [Mycobacteroides abscessus]SKS30374.1 Uncharacterised protein [Mycobacteroides abscessus subsp. abscessus]SHU53346.1 Uncharacterised protein [Mycobacteroides abscessus subsp. bolletii]SHW62131.1 Uncharacterised protein [Mycobacteroides abscessus subsp. bolletii]SHW90034.1 Uncharacterised protein [Mycobacteroides abscessus subsp. bolletii]SHX35604.1 Uncharacterised protein [Mycobacteroides abscessus subsp. bolletii]